VHLKRKQFTVLFCFIFFLTSQMSFAGPILYRVQMKKRMEAQQQMQIQEEIEAHEHAAVVVDQEQRPATYQETVDRRNQAIAQAIMDASTHPQAIANEEAMNIQPVASESAPAPSFLQWVTLKLSDLYTVLKRFIDGIIGFILNKAPEDQDQQQSSDVDAQAPVASPGSSSASHPPAGQVPTAASADSQDEVDLSEVWKKLDKKSTVWMALADDQSKLLTVSEYISRFQKEGVKISAPASHYVQMIEQVAGQNPQMLDRPFGELLQVLAIIDYDFDNGMDKDALAKQVLGEAGYEQNKQRFVQAQQAQQQQQGQQPGQQQQ